MIRTKNRSDVVLFRDYTYILKFAKFYVRPYTSGSSCKVQHAGQLSDSFEVKTGVRQGCLLSPFLFLLVIDWAMRATTTGRRNGIQWTMWEQLDDLDFANDLELLTHSYTQMQEKTNHLSTTSAKAGLQINKAKQS